MPGWGCCKCHTYNGLQRNECKMYQTPRHEIEIPKDLTVCSTCGFGVDEKWKNQFKVCPVCDNPKFNLKDKLNDVRN